MVSTRSFSELTPDRIFLPVTHTYGIILDLSFSRSSCFSSYPAIFSSYPATLHLLSSKDYPSCLCSVQPGFVNLKSDRLLWGAHFWQRSRRQFQLKALAKPVISHPHSTKSLTQYFYSFPYGVVRGGKYIKYNRVLILVILYPIYQKHFNAIMTPFTGNKFN